MSLTTTYPIVTYGSNVDIIRQAHNLLTSNVGDIAGLQTATTESLVDAINSLQSAFSALTVSAYPPLNNEQWLTAFTDSGFGTLNLFKLSSDNEFVIGQHIIPLSTLTDLGKSGTAWRAGYITTVHTSKIQVIPTTNLDLTSDTFFTFTLNASQLSLTQANPLQLTLETTGEALDIKSIRTRIYSGSQLFDLTPSGHLEPGVNETQNIGSTSKRINIVHTKDLNVSGSAVFNGNVSMPNSGVAMPIGGGCMWFTPTPPANYLIANGQAISRTEYSDLFAVYGVSYGAGNGTTTFNIPDMRDRVPHGVNTSRTLTAPNATAPGLVFGSLNHTHNVTLPRHSHSSTGLTIADHSGQVTGAPSVLPSAGFTGNALDAHGHSISQTPHGHSISDPGHGHNITDPGHSHGAGLPSHSHFVDTAGRSSGNTNTDPGTWFNGSNGSPQIPLMTNLGVDYNILTFSAPLLGVNVDSASVVSQGLSVIFNTTQISVNANNANISVNGASAGVPSGTVTLSNTSHSHAIPTLTHTIGGTVGITPSAGGTNGDIDTTLVTNGSNPPSFCVHFIIRAK